MLNDFNNVLKNNDLKFIYNNFVIKINLLIKKFKLGRRFFKIFY